MLKRVLITGFLASLFLLAACGTDGTDPVDATVDSVDSAISDSTVGDESGTDTAVGETTDQGGDTSQPGGPKRLSANGMDIVDSDGNVVILKGVNLGGYLYHETWLTLVDYSAQARAFAVAEELGMTETIRPILVDIGPYAIAGMVGVTGGDGSALTPDSWVQILKDRVNGELEPAAAQAYIDKLDSYLPAIYDDSDLPIFLKLEDRFGPEKRDELLDAYLGAWIQEKDIQWLSEQGFNLVRVPMGYRSLTTGSHKEQPTELNWNEATFKRIDDLLDWCEKWGVYAVMDIQECPGGQNDYSGESLLYGSEFYQNLTVQLWEELSDRFRDRNIVAAYSLLAEPMSAPSLKARDEMYDKLVKAIRAKGDDHLLVIHDGFKGMDQMPDPAKYGWTNVIYSTHIFEWGARSFDAFKSTIDLYEFVFRPGQEVQNVPYFIGSFSGIFDEPWAYESVEYITAWFAKYGWSWSSWCYKDIQDPIAADLWGDKSSWGMKSRLSGPFDRPDLFVDDEATLKQKFESYADLEPEVNQTLVDILKADAAATR